MEKLNIGVIGLGVMGTNHARVYSELENVNLVAICDSNIETLDLLSTKYNTNKYSNHKDMLDNEKIDAVSLCVPTLLHKNIALDIIKNKINLLIEKPIATTTDEATEIINQAKDNNIKLMVGHIERFNPVVTELKKRISDNELGNIFKVHCVRQSQFPQRIIDVGVIIDLSIHEIDNLCYLIESKIKRVFAETAQRIHSNHEDLLIGTLRFENNVLGVINSNWLSPKKVREITVTGEKGTFHADYITQELNFLEKEFAKNTFEYGSASNKQGLKIDINNKEPLKIELTEFINCISNNTDPMVSGSDGLNALNIAQKFLESSKTNKVIEL
tara:strand:- start:204 stop:1190 length:987 start_codon:yes stop_codon:yes gene_type:complete